MPATRAVYACAKLLGRAATQDVSMRELRMRQISELGGR